MKAALNSLRCAIGNKLAQRCHGYLKKRCFHKEVLEPSISVKTSGLRICLIGCAIAITSLSLAADELDPVNPAKGVRTWRWSGDGVRLRLTQILPDQVRGFYQARGFSVEATEFIARACVFQTVLKNDAASGPVEINLAEWWIKTDGRQRALKLEQQWQHQWKQLDVSQSARLAFRWALFPTVQSFANGDWNMGMTTFALPPSTVFDLHVTWRVGDRSYDAVVRDVECAPRSAKEGA